jgi:hypothetical protein
MKKIKRKGHWYNEQQDKKRQKRGLKYNEHEQDEKGRQV